MDGLTSRDHEAAEGIDKIGERVCERDGAEPSGHDRDGIDGVAGKEERHGEHLADAQETLAGFHDAGNDERKRGKNRAAKQHAKEYPGNRERIPLNINAQQKGDEINDGGLHGAAESCGYGFADDERGAVGRADEKLVDDSEVALPDDGDAIEDGGEEDALREDAGRHEGEVGDISRGDAANAAEDLPENHEPKHRLDGAAEKFGGVAEKFPQFDLSDGAGFAEEIRDEREGLAKAAGCASSSLDIEDGPPFLDGRAAVMNEDVVERSCRPKSGFQFGGGAGDGNLSQVHEREFIAKRVGLFHVMRGDEDGHAEIAAQVAEAVPNSAAGDGVEADGGLVKK